MNIYLFIKENDSHLQNLGANGKKLENKIEVFHEKKSQKRIYHGTFKRSHYVNDNFCKLQFASLSMEARTANEINKYECFDMKDKFLCYYGRVCMPKFVNINLTL